MECEHHSRKVEQTFLQLKNDWPQLFECIDLERVSDKELDRLSELSSKAFDFASISNGGRGEFYRRAQGDPLIRRVGIRRLFELISPQQNINNLSPDMKIMDVLGGDGVLARAIRYFLPPSMIPGILTGDLSEEMVIAARAYGLFAVRQAAQNLLMKDQCLDGIIIAYGTHHISINDRLQMCREAFRTLKPHGRIVLHDFEANSQVAQWFKDVVDPYSLTGHIFPHFTNDEIKNYLFEAGFINVDVQYIYDPFIVVADSKDLLKQEFSRYLLNMYGLTKLQQMNGIDKSLEIIFELANKYFKYDFSKLNVDNSFGQSEIRIGREGDYWFIEAPRVAIVGCGEKPANDTAVVDYYKKR